MDIGQAGQHPYLASGESCCQLRVNTISCLFELSKADYLSRQVLIIPFSNVDSGAQNSYCDIEATLNLA